MPVEPPGFGRGLINLHDIFQPSFARWYTMPLPTIPAPITTHFALAGTLLIALILVLLVVVIKIYGLTFRSLQHDYA